MIEQTRFLGTVFLCSEFNLENIYSGVNFRRKNVWGNFYLRELIFEDHKKNRKNAEIRTRKNVVPHGTLQLSNFVTFRIDSMKRRNKWGRKQK